MRQCVAGDPPRRPATVGAGGTARDHEESLASTAHSVTTSGALFSSRDRRIEPIGRGNHIPTPRQLLARLLRALAQLARRSARAAAPAVDGAGRRDRRGSVRPPPRHTHPCQPRWADPTSGWVLAKPRPPTVLSAGCLRHISRRGKGGRRQYDFQPTLNRTISEALKAAALVLVQRNWRQFFEDCPVSM